MMCKFKQKLQLRLKGLCNEHKVDTEYFLLGYEVLEQGGKQRRKYGGSMGWMLSFDEERDAFTLEHHHYPQFTLTMEDKDLLPVGLHSWRVENNTCNLGQTNRSIEVMLTSMIIQLAIFSVQLQLSACPLTHFTCQDGKCISMERRCDNIEVYIL